jgi:hypothetical protein
MRRLLLALFAIAVIVPASPAHARPVSGEYHGVHGHLQVKFRISVFHTVSKLQLSTGFSPYMLTNIAKSPLHLTAKDNLVPPQWDVEVQWTEHSTSAHCKVFHFQDHQKRLFAELTVHHIGH